MRFDFILSDKYNHAEKEQIAAMQWDLFLFYYAD